MQVLKRQYAAGLVAARAVPRCGARTRAGCPCEGPRMPNGRCRFHGGKSTGARTPEGLERTRRVRLKHGQCSAEVREASRLRGEARRVIKELEQLIASAGS